MEPDRWAEERRRGMTIDLGYAWGAAAVGGGARLRRRPRPPALHRQHAGRPRAGAGRDGRRGGRRGLAPAERRAPGRRRRARADDRPARRHPQRPRRPRARPRRRRWRRSPGAASGQVEAVAVSGATGAGLPELRAALDRLVAGLPDPDVQAPVRLWVDRAFTVRGSGTVVTGTLGQGVLRVGDTLELDGRPVRVRGLQSLGQRLRRGARGRPGRGQPARASSARTPGAGRRSPAPAPAGRRRRSTPG